MKLGSEKLNSRGGGGLPKFSANPPPYYLNETALMPRSPDNGANKLGSREHGTKKVRELRYRNRKTIEFIGNTKFC